MPRSLLRGVSQEFFMGDKCCKRLWSQDVEEKWHAPEGFFEKSPDDIAKGLKEASDSLAQAMDRLDFYINRAGTNLSAEAKARLEKAKGIVRNLYEK